MKTLIQLLTILALLSTSACGYLLYPEREGQRHGKLDPTVALLDGGALFIGVLPGVVAFAVDLTTGTLYLPPGGRSALDKHRHRLSALEPGEGPNREDRAAIARKLAAWLEQPVDTAELRFYRFEDGPAAYRMQM